jgi:hypothetical protein
MQKFSIHFLKKKCKKGLFSSSGQIYKTCESKERVKHIYIKTTLWLRTKFNAKTGPALADKLALHIKYPRNFQAFALFLLFTLRHSPKRGVD